MRFPIEDGPPSARSFGPADDGGGRDGRERKRTKDKKPIWVDSIEKPNRDAPNQKLDHNVIIDEAKLGTHYASEKNDRAQTVPEPTTI